MLLRPRSASEVTSARVPVAGVVTLGALRAFSALVSVELTVRGASIVASVGVREASAPDRQPTAQLVATAVALRADATVRLAAGRRSGLGYAVDRVVVLTTPAPAGLVEVRITRRYDGAAGAPRFADAAPAVRAYSLDGRRARLLRAYEQYTLRVLDAYDPAVECAAPVLSCAQGTVVGATLLTADAPAWTVQSARAAEFGAGAETLAAGGATVLLLLAGRAGADCLFRLGGAGSLPLTQADATAAFGGWPSVWVESGGGVVAAAGLGAGLYSAPVAPDAEVALRELRFDGEACYFEPGPAVRAAEPRPASAARLVGGAAQRLHLVELLGDDGEVRVPTRVPAAPATVVCSDGAVVQASASVAGAAVQLDLRGEVRVYSAALPAGTECSDGTVAPALTATAGGGSVFCVPVVDGREVLLYGLGTVRAALAVRLALDADGRSVPLAGVTAAAADVGVEAAADARGAAVGSATLSTGATAPVLADVVGTAAPLFGAARVTLADGRALVCPLDAVYAGAIARVALVPAGHARLVAASGAAVGADGAATWALAPPWQPAPGASRRFEVTGATLAVGQRTALAAAVGATLATATYVAVAHGTATSNMGLGSDPGTRAVPFDAAASGFSTSVPATVGTLYLRFCVAGTEAAVGFVDAEEVALSVDAGASFAAAAKYGGDALLAERQLASLAGPYWRASGPLLAAYVGGADAATLRVRVRGLLLEGGRGQDAALLWSPP
jgi:hypothetical protein